MIYQNDSYSFTLSLTRETTTVLEISAVTYNSSINPYAVYTFELLSGPYPTIGTKIVITGVGSPGLSGGNQGTFTIADLDQLIDSMGINVGGTFSVTNTNAVTETATGSGTVGTAPNVTTSPVLQIIKLADLSTVLVSPAPMTPLDASHQLWIYTWSVGSVASGEYAAIVSYAADGNTFSGKFIEKVRVGDSYILGTVALDDTVAKQTTVAKDATVAHSTDLAAIDPNTSAIVLAIKAKTDNLPSDPAGMTLLATTTGQVIDVWDAILGSQAVDKTQNPAVFTLTRVNNAILAQYYLTDNPSETARTKF